MPARWLPRPYGTIATSLATMCEPTTTQLFFFLGLKPDEIQRIDKHGEMLKEKLIQQLKNRSGADRDLDMMLFLEEKTL